MCDSQFAATREAAPVYLYADVEYFDHVLSKVDRILEGFRQDHIQFAQAVNALEAYYEKLSAESRAHFSICLGVSFIRKISVI